TCISSRSCPHRASASWPRHDGLRPARSAPRQPVAGGCQENPQRTRGEEGPRGTRGAGQGLRALRNRPTTELAVAPASERIDSLDFLMTCKINHVRPACPATLSAPDPERVSPVSTWRGGWRSLS